MARLRLILVVLLAGAVSLAAGLAVNWLAAMMPCRGEGLACNIDTAVGAYGAVISAGAGTLVFLVALLIADGLEANSRKALAIALALLLLPLLLFLLVTQMEHATMIGFEPYRQLRTVLVMILPPALAALTQYAILRRLVPAAPAAHTP